MPRKKRIPNLDRVVLTDIGNKGKAVGRYNDQVVFVTGAVPGDVVEVQVTKKRRSYLEGKAVSILEYSPDRVEAACEHFGVCGGCKWQQLSYEKQLEFKEKEVRENLRKIGHVQPEEFLPILGSDPVYWYRNKLEFSFTDNKWLTQAQLESDQTFDERRGAGFHIPGFWDKILDIEQCHLQPEPSNGIRNFIRDYGKKHNLPFWNPRSQEGWLRTLMIRVTLGGEVLVVVQFKEEREEDRKALFDALIQAFPQITSLQYTINNKGNDTLYDLDVHTYYGQSYVSEYMPRYSGDGQLSFKIGPKSFYQTNPKQAHALYKVAADLAEVKKDETVFDLYTGTGTIALYLAEVAKKVIGIELVPEAIADAKLNAKANGIENAHFYTGDMKAVFTPEFIAKHGKPDLLITDPPREGMHADVVQHLLDLEINRMVYVSCNSATQARDLQLLSEKYRVVKSRAVDMFPQTHHIENVVLLVLKEEKI